MFDLVAFAGSLGATLGFMNSGTARRSLWAPAGDVTVPSVVDGNMFMARHLHYCP